MKGETAPSLLEERQFVRQEEGQDLVEYTLLLAFVCLASAALFIQLAPKVAGFYLSISRHGGIVPAITSHA